MKKRISFSVLVTIMILITSIIIPMIFTKNQPVVNIQNQTIASRDESKEDNIEMRGLWVSFISLDMTGTDRTFGAFKTKFDEIIKKAKEYKCNTLIVQVRPFSDALYNSKFFPHSHILSGTQGISPDYDGLSYMCSAAHKANLRIHAWINPYRIKTSETPDILSDDNIFLTEPDICIETNSGAYLNPAKKEARELITKGVKEIVENYDVDGIQFDDYFYPPDINDEDYTDYNTHKESTSWASKALTIEEWRKTNVNIMIAEVYKTVKTADKNIVFGISPQGNLQNNSEICADAESWCKYSGYADYICPQVYFSIDNEALRFEDCLKQWSALSYHKNIKVYIGLGAYKAGTDADNGTWLQDNDILAKELKLLRDYGFSGYMIYDYNALESESALKEMQNFKSSI